MEPSRLQVHFNKEQYTKQISRLFEDTRQHLTPLVLDLDGDGIELTARTDGNVAFDLDGDGFAEWTGWVAADDGLLALDRDGNGRIDDISELFGSPTADGFAELAALDANGDGVIDAADADFANLRVWIDADQDGFSDDGELHTLADLTIRSLDLAAVAADTWQAGNRIGLVSHYTTTDGATRTLADVWFEVDQMYTRYIGDVTLDPAVIGLPILRGYGNVPDLYTAMSLDETLRQQVEAFTATPVADLATTRAQAEAILFRWAGQDGVDPGSRHPYDDARIVGTLEAFTATTVPDGAPFFEDEGRQKMAEAWDTLVTAVHARLLVQGPLADVMPDMRFDFVTDTIIGTADWATVLAPFIAGTPTDTRDALLYWRHVLTEISTGLVREHDEARFLDAADAALADAGLHISGRTVLTYAAWLDAVDLGSAEDDALIGTSNGELFIGFAGDDVMQGDTAGHGGGDVYVVAKGDGDDTVVDFHGSQHVERRGSDTLKLEGITSDEVEFIRRGNDLVVRLLDSGQETTVQNEYVDGDIHGVETYAFDDVSLSVGTVLSLAYIAGTDGADTLIGGGGGDRFRGFAGDDVMQGYTGGENGGDVYIVARGDGNDTIIDYHGSQYAERRGSDTLRLEGIASDEVEFLRRGDDLVVRLLDSGQEITVQDEYVDGDIYGVETYAFDDVSLSVGAVLSLAYIAGTDGADTLLGGDGHDRFRGFGGDDVMQGYTGGEGGGDVYIVARGDGNDTIVDYHGSQHAERRGSDTLKLEGIASDEVEFLRRDNDLVVRLLDSGQETTVQNEYVDGDVHGVETYVFDDVSLSVVTVLSRAYIGGTDGADTLVGADGGDVFRGLAGDDVMRGHTGGHGGGDLYIVAKGDGNDTIVDYHGSQHAERRGSDTLKLEGIASDEVEFIRRGNDLVVRLLDTGQETTVRNEYVNGDVHGVETYVFDDVSLSVGTVMSRAYIGGTDGDDTLIGGSAADSFRGFAGDDVMQGYAGGEGSGDLYIVAKGDGNDTVIDFHGSRYAHRRGSDTLELEGIVSEEVEFIRRGSDLVVRLKETGQEVTVQDEFRGHSRGSDVYGVETYRFDDISLSEATAKGLAIFRGTAGDDVVTGGSGNDTIVGAEGNDTLSGGSGADVFGFAAGHGHDRITDFRAGIDKIDLAEHSLSSFDDVTAALTQTTDGAFLGVGPEDDILFEGVLAADFTADDFLFV